MIGSRLPTVVWISVAIPIASRQSLMKRACSPAAIPSAAPTARGSTKGEMSTSVCCQP